MLKTAKREEIGNGVENRRALLPTSLHQKGIPPFPSIL